MGKPEGRALGRPRRTWEDNIKMDIRAVVWERHELGRSGSGQGQVAGCCKCGTEPWGSIKIVGNLLSS